MQNKTSILFILLLISNITFAQHHHFTSGYSFSASICNDSTIQTWGDNYYGQLGRKSDICNYTTPCTLPYLQNVISIDGGFSNFCCALTSDGYVLSWGHNFYGELGNGEICPSSCQQNLPDTVLGGETGDIFLQHVIAISVGQTHAYALLESGEVVAWGDNTYGQLGDGTTTNKIEPCYVKYNSSERLQHIQTIAAGGNHGYALTNDGIVYAWGKNSNGELGCGTTETQLYPQFVIDKNGNTLNSIKQIDGGMSFGLMLHENGRVYGVGAYKGTALDENGIRYKTNTYADLILGGETPNYYLENVQKISAGFTHSLAITQENEKSRVVSWGDNRFPNLSQEQGGQLGNNNKNTLQALNPVYMKTADDLLQGVTNIFAGCGISQVQVSFSPTYINHLYACGCNSYAQLGFDNTDDKYYLQQINTICSLFDAEYYGPIYNVSGKIQDSKGDAIFDATINIYNEDSTFQSTQSDLSGEFNFSIRPCTSTIFVKKTSNLYEDTWCCNTQEREKAYKFIIDANITNIIITMIDKLTNIEDILQINNLDKAEKISIYSINGKILQKIDNKQFDLNIIKKYNQPIIILYQIEKKQYVIPIVR